MATILSILGAGGAEFVVMATSMYLELTKCCRKKKKKKVIAAAKSIKPNGVERTSDALGGKADPIGWTQSFGESSSLNGKKKSRLDKKFRNLNRNNSSNSRNRAKPSAKKNKILNADKFIFDEFGAFQEESEPKGLEGDGLEGRSSRSSRMRQVGIPVKIKFKHQKSKSEKEKSTEFDKIEKNKADFWDFSMKK